MSVKVASLDFDREVENWLMAFPHAEKDQRSSFYHRMKAEMRIMRYMEIHQGKVTIHRHPMLEVLASFKVAKRHEDLVKIDLETVWGKFLARDDRAIHAFLTTDRGFDLLFAVTPKNAYVLSGVMQITALRG